ncbi:protein of unknown function (plasmid) [Cupriavidus taiwanensis]|uniref:Transposase n=1 Tax=Cupriavidus taiwanensis TaxID=164546 RepID=A0A7Z7NRW1_9BURK|nr:hypothetical protein CBM2597_U50018 [Cupriavidus taiwanensis]SPC26152.1 hypothetical protein CBM2594_U60018 [Cupriavidus taiwanensis]SPD37714.1 protein of unknown function [Cupriavidus taiwanensis]
MLNPIDYLWAWLKRHAIANFCPDNLNELQTTARNKLRSAQHPPSIIAACCGFAHTRTRRGWPFNSKNNFT